MIYFDNAATTLIKPEGVTKANDYALKNLCANAGRGSHAASMKAAALIYKARQSVCGLVGADETVFTFNCTDALNTAIFGTARRGHVVTTVFEHNSVLRPLEELRRRGMINYTVVAPDIHGVIDPADVEKAITRDTYMIIANHISNVSGVVAPVAAIGHVAKRHGLLYLVDGAQSVGYEDTDMRKIGCDLMCFAPHKGLHGVQGIGCLCIRKNVHVAPVRFGGTGTNSHSLAQPSEIPDGLECGTMPVNAIYSLIGAINYHNSLGISDKRNLAECGNFIRNELKKISGIKLYGKYNLLPNIVCFNIDGMNASAAGDILNEQYDIAVRCGLHCAPLAHKYYGTLATGSVRASLSYHNTPREAEFFVKAIYEIAK